MNARMLQALLLFVVTNGTSEALSLQVCCEGYPYGQIITVRPGESATWEWQPGRTSVVGYDAKGDWKLWGPRWAAQRKEGEIRVRLLE